jgi:hypothetical protein
MILKSLAGNGYDWYLWHVIIIEHGWSMMLKNCVLVLQVYRVL